VAVDGLTFNHEDDVREGWVVDNLAHVEDERVDCFTVDFILFKLSDIKNANVVEPLASIETTENEELLHADDACGVALPTGWCLFILNRMAPSQRIRIQHIQVVTGNNLLEGLAPSVVPAEKVDFVSN